MAGEIQDDLLAKHFEAAGIVNEQPSGEADANTSSEAPAGEEKTGPQGSDAKQPSDAQQEGAQDQKPAAADQNSGSKPADDGKKQEQKGQGSGSGNPGDLTLSDGSVIKAGAERRLYENLQTERQRVTHLRTEKQQVETALNDARTKLQTYEENFKQIGVTDPVHVSAATRLYRDLSTNPVPVLKQLLAEAKALGHNLDGIGAGVDTAAIQLMLDQKLGKTSENNSTVDIEQEAARDTADFLSKFPDAVTHENEIAQLVALNPRMSLADIYFEFKNTVISQGFDWSKPLQPQIAARASQEKPAAPVTPNGQPPLVNGRGVAPNVTGANFDEKDVLKSGSSDSLDDIIRQAMREANLS